MSSIKSLTSKFKDLNTSRKISVIMLISIIISGYIVSILSMIAISNVLDIISDVEVPDGYIKANFNIENPNDMEVEIPFDLSNEGIYDLVDINMDVKIKVDYINNITRESKEIEIFSKKIKYGTLGAGNSLNEIFKGDVDDFDTKAIYNFFKDADIFEEISILISIKLEAKYFFNLIEFTIFNDDLDLTDYECTTCTGG